jgi:hypothetical protein
MLYKSEVFAQLGVEFAWQGQEAAAEAAFRQALELWPGNLDAQFGLSLVLLRAGRYAEAWPLYEARYAPERFAPGEVDCMDPGVPCPRWRGEPLAGKSLLIWREQGRGDMIQFGRYIAWLKAQGAARIVLACEAPLKRLLRRVAGLDAILTRDEKDMAFVAQALTGHDYWTLPMSLALHAGTTLGTIPPSIYLESDPDLAPPWRERLAPLEGPRVGLAWQGDPRNLNDASRSLPSLRTLAPLWRVPGIHFVSLQTGEAARAALSAPADQPLLPLGAALQDFADTAAVIDQLDLVITVDTAMAHLAGSLGKPCWLLLHAFRTDWRWLLGRADSPWYPQGMRLFRQPIADDWNGALAQVAQALRHEAPWTI